MFRSVIKRVSPHRKLTNKRVNKADKQHQLTASQHRYFSKNVHNVHADLAWVDSNSVADLYRGIFKNIFDADTFNPLFRERSILTGLASFAGFNPNEAVIDNYVISQHKERGMFVSLSEDEALSAEFFAIAGPVLTINFKHLPDLVLADAEKCYQLSNQGISFRENGKEKEKTVFAVDYSSIKKIRFHSYQIPDARFCDVDNPFYLDIDPWNPEHCRLNQDKYDALCRLYHAMIDANGNPVDAHKEAFMTVKKDYFSKLFQVYEAVRGHDNPFHWSLLTLLQRNPNFAYHFFARQNGDYEKRYLDQCKRGLKQTTVLEFLTDNQPIEKYIATFSIDPTRERFEKEIREKASYDYKFRDALKLKGPL